MARKKNKKVANADADSDDFDLETSSICSSESNYSFPTEFDETALNDLVLKVQDASMELMNARPDARLVALKSTLRCLQNVFLDLDSETSLARSLMIGIESVLKKGTDVEKVLASNVIAAVAIQLGPSQTEEWLRSFQPILDQLLCDKTLSPQIRGAASVAVSVLIWQAPDELDSNSAKQIMNNLFSIFRGACLKGDGKSPVHDSVTCDMQEDAINSWVRVLLSISSNLASELGEAMIVHFVSILQNVNVDLRIASAEALAIVFEHIRDEKNDRYTGPYYRQIVSQLDDLIALSSKSVSKKDKKKQRACLRPVVTSIRTQNHPEVNIKFGTEQVLLDTCALNFFYESLCDVLAHGVDRHLQMNTFIRDMFDLGPPIKRTDLACQDRKETKAQRQFMNQVVSKNRDQVRGFSRNKKSSFQNHFED